MQSAVIGKVSNVYSQIIEKSKGYLRVSLCVQVCIIIMAQTKQFGCRWNGG